MNTKCSNCQKQIEIPSWKFKNYKGRQANKHFFCSRKCFQKYWIENIAKIKENHPRWKGGNIKSICKNCGKEFEVRRKGKNRKYIFCSKKCFGKWLVGKYTREKNPNWKGSPPNKSRTETNYLKWQKKIKRIEKYTCQKCGTKENLNVHHIKSYKEFPELRYDISNGITLCKKCHIKIHKTP